MTAARTDTRLGAHVPARSPAGAASRKPSSRSPASSCEIAWRPHRRPRLSATPNSDPDYHDQPEPRAPDPRQDPRDRATQPRHEGHPDTPPGTRRAVTRSLTTARIPPATRHQHGWRNRLTYYRSSPTAPGSIAPKDGWTLPEDTALFPVRILACDLGSSGCQAARSYSLIRPLRTGFRRIWHVPGSAAVTRGAGSGSGTRWPMP